jgi:hypothetical protein
VNWVLPFWEAIKKKSSSHEDKFQCQTKIDPEIIAVYKIKGSIHYLKK